MNNTLVVILIVVLLGGLAFFFINQQNQNEGNVNEGGQTEQPEGEANNEQGQTEEVTHVFDYVCPEGETIRAIYNEDGDEVRVVMPDNKTHDLVQVISASGARYAPSEEDDKSFVFWNKGSEVTVYENEEIIFQDCVS